MTITLYAKIYSHITRVIAMCLSVPLCEDSRLGLYPDTKERYYFDLRLNRQDRMGI